MTAYGQQFAPGAILRWNGVAMTTTFVNSTQLTGSLPTSLLTPADSYLLTESSNGTLANCVLVAVAPPVSLFSVTPSQTDAGGPAFSATVLGSGFTAGSQVLWSGAPVPTAFIGPGQLGVSVPAATIAISGRYSLTVLAPGGAVSNAVPFYVQTVLSSISPNLGVAGSPGIAVTATGVGFAPGDVLVINRFNVRTNLPTTLLSSTKLSTVIPASSLTTAGQATLTATDGNSTSGIASRAAAFRIGNAPAVSTLSTPTRESGSSAFTLTVTGGGFVPGSSIQWNGAPLPTTFVSDTQVTANVPASMVATPATVGITVANPAGSVSNVMSFVVTPPGLSISALAPASAVAGGPAFTLAITGAGFSAGASVLWNGKPLPTTPASDTQLLAAIPAAMIAASSVASVAVSTPAGASNALRFPIVPPTPVAPAEGIVNAFGSTPSLAPGSLISIYGSNLAAADGTPDAPALAQNTIGATSVFINGAASPLLYASPTLVNAQVPFETPPGAASLVVDVAGVHSAPATIQVAAAAPGVAFTSPNHALAVNFPDGSLNSAASPARPGQYVIVYLTGQGSLDVHVATGEPAPPAPFSRPTADVQARVGGLPAQVGFAGLVPGWVGVLQMNLIIPRTAPGEQPLEIAIGGVSANPTVLSIQAN